MNGAQSTAGQEVESSARQLLERRDFAGALDKAGRALQAAPSDRDALYVKAVALRYLGRVAEAIGTLDQLRSAHPKFARQYQERGHCQIALRDAPAAIESFESAVQLTPALPGSWRALGSLYQMVGRSEDASIAGAHLAKLAALPPEVVTGTALFTDGDVGEAEAAVRRLLHRSPDDIEGLRLLARIAAAADVLDDAERLLERLLALAPDYAAARHEYVIVLMRRHRHGLAREQIARLLAEDPHSRIYRTTEAAALMGIGDFQGAIQRYERLSEEAPGDPDLHLSIAHAAKALGRAEEAVRRYRRTRDLKPGYGEAYWSLANMKTYRFSTAEIKEMQRYVELAEISPEDRYHLCFALGKAHEDSSEFARSWEFYERGNAIKQAIARYTPTAIENLVQRQIDVCTREFFEARAGLGHSSAEPLFIVGLPRSGSTLLEQILASHSSVEGTMELGDVPRLVQDLNHRSEGRPELTYPAVLAEITEAEIETLAQRYLDDTRVYRVLGRALYIDKNPNNFRNIGLIHLMFPKARIIDARREAMACCFSNFKQLFAVGQLFTYSLENIARYYRAYIRLMNHWDRVLPGVVLRVEHETVVDDLEGSIRRLLEYCGLPFEAECLAYHETARSVNTASSEQVRRPIYREGLDQWRNYEPWLQPLRDALQLAGAK